ncbi:NAD(P)H-binding protein [Fructilactobacillus fructivorans]|uniref:Putative oxidoreductase (Putative) n=1 Tax=Fructilactobacillus fructivorans TaxID=1614 RepID=A0A0C1PNZ1_9LACO|nr:NAD(P)H-binding protein [Fructilactobacillus fructivorans]KID42482.1 putative oxidoreductase (putative) [Fructilactobacillus fructivorans]MCT0151597.1 NAD-dependent epimerase/dehydratase family protein [Fructilactobacillus fructivorans]MCT2868093.1 NAD-dependent epimerase/dehydratase family protein [Fructilactobacillus fructivorans]MCT2868590.1 NAD-dependent epimerase/dehydratase family protein [Fructilactobacillus fructivorans]MCT2873784.1 NAD-dependent epimerase/dehydratase family protein
MKKILIIGATGNVGQAVRRNLLDQTDDFLTLFSRSSGQKFSNNDREKAISGDVNDLSALEKVVKGQDEVFVALSGNLPEMAKNIVQAMDDENVKRLIFITSMGIYNEVPAKVSSSGNLKNNSRLEPYRKAADVIESSDLDYTLIRPGWFDNGSSEYEITYKGQSVSGNRVAIASIADLATRLLQDRQLDVRESIAINRKS